MHTYQYEYTDTFAGESNHSWVYRGEVIMPELTHYGYDGSTNYVKANRVFERELMKRVKAKLGLTGIRGTKDSYWDSIEFRPCGMATVLFINYKES